MMAMIAGGLVLLGPPCSLWVFMSSSFHCRSDEFWDGDCSKPAVRAANALVRNVCLILAIGHVRGVFYILEQPGSSKMENYGWLKALSNALQATRVYTWMREYGHLLPKPTYLLSNLPTC